MHDNYIPYITPRQIEGMKQNMYERRQKLVRLFLDSNMMIRGTSGRSGPKGSKAKASTTAGTVPSFVLLLP